jgi:hypothetical protein
MTDGTVQGERVAGPALNAEVAERVMGLDLTWRRFSLDGLNRDLGPVRAVPAYSTDLAAAWGVVEALRACGFEVEIGSRTGGGWYASIVQSNGWGYRCDECDGPVDPPFAYADTTPLAICRAALAALDATAGQTPPNEG